MPAGWEQRFDFYIGRFEGSAMVVHLDMAAIDHVPVDSHATAIEIGVPMKHPDANGLRSSVDFEAMIEIEDRLKASLESGADAIYWGREISKGSTNFFFYVSPEPGDALQELVTELSLIPGYSPRRSFGRDPEWNLYRRRYPSSYHRQTMSNRKLQRQLEKQGDRLSKRRVVDHVALFTSAEAANEAAARLKKSKFRADRVEGPDDTGTYLLEFHRRDRCDGDDPNRITAEVLDCIEPSGGIYDGWGCVVRK